MVLSATSPWQTGDNVFDVNADQLVTAQDALLVVNRLNASGPGPLPSAYQPAADGSARYVDVNGEGQLTVADVDAVVAVLPWEEAFLVVNTSSPPSDVPTPSPSDVPTPSPSPDPSPSGDPSPTPTPTPTPSPTAPPSFDTITASIRAAPPETPGVNGGLLIAQPYRIRPNINDDDHNNVPDLQDNVVPGEADLIFTQVTASYTFQQLKNAGYE